MEGSFTQRVRRIYEEKERKYPIDKSGIFQGQRHLVRQLLNAGRITMYQQAAYLQFLGYLETLSFLDMIATVAQVSTRTVERTIFETKDDEVAGWTTTSSILRALGVNQVDIWELYMLYVFERAEGVRKKTRATQQTPAIPKEDAEPPRTEPIGNAVRLREVKRSLFVSKR